MSKNTIFALCQKNLNCLTQTEIRLAGVDATVYVRFVCQKGSFSPSHFRFKKEISIFVLLQCFISSNSKVYLRLLFIQQQRFSGKWSRGYIYLSENVSLQPITYPTATFQREMVPRLYLFKRKCLFTTNHLSNSNVSAGNGPEVNRTSGLPVMPPKSSRAG